MPFMEPGDSLPLSKLEPLLKFSTDSRNLFKRLVSNIILHLRLCLPCGLLHWIFRLKMLEFPLSPLTATSPSLLVLLKLFALIVFAEQHSALHYAVSCSFL